MIIVSRSDCAKIRSYINEQLMYTGERDRLKDLLRSRLVECGWRDELKSYCKGISFSEVLFMSFLTILICFSSSLAEIIAKKGLTYVTVNDLVIELTPVARRLVPDSVKQELVDELRKFLPKDNEDNDDTNE